jgi:hypothetical protein
VIRKALTITLSVGLVVIIIIGIVNFDLFLLIWVRILAAVVMVGTVVALMRNLFRL